MAASTSKLPTAKQLETDFMQLSRSMHDLEDEIARRSMHASTQASKPPPFLLHFDELSVQTGNESECMQAVQQQKPKRKEIEARRFSGKENVVEYLMQFELTAKRNDWDDNEKACSLLCALDGPARGILSEFDDATKAEFREVKQALLLRFGPTSLTEVHEQALVQLRLSKGQAIREMAREVQRLTKLAYPDILGRARDRLAVKSLIRTITDKDTAFYIKEKSPATLAEVCTLYERYQALTSDDHSSHKAMKTVKQTDTTTTDDQIQQQVASAIEKMAEAANCQLKNLTEALTKTRTASQRPAANEAVVPRKPCPRCKQRGHWARDCPLPQSAALCFTCGQPGHIARDCQTYLNWQRLTQASSVGLQNQQMY
jgi:hypothetical protein